MIRLLLSLDCFIPVINKLKKDNLQENLLKFWKKEAITHKIKLYKVIYQYSLKIKSLIYKIIKCFFKTFINLINRFNNKRKKKTSGLFKNA